MSDDESLARLRAADPAEGQASDLAALRRAVDDRLGDEAPSKVAPRPAPRDELAARRERRSTRSGWLAGVAAAVIVGVGGYMVGVNTTAGGAGGASDVAYEDSGAAADGEELAGADDAAPTSDEAEAQGAENEAMSDSDDTTPGRGPVAFEESGLSNETGRAEAFAYDPAGIAGAERAAELAAAVDVAGEVTETGGAWMVTDANGRTIELHDDSTATFSFIDPMVDPWTCSDCGTTVDPVRTAQQFLTAIGVDTTGLRLVEEAGDGGAVDVFGYAEGSTALTWSVTVTVDGVYAARGWLAPLVSLGSYDVISPVDAVERLADPRFGAESSGDLAAESTGTGSVPEPGAPLPWPVETRTITDAELTLAAYPLGDAVALLPAWSLTDDDGGIWIVLAVTEDSLDFSAG